MAFGINQRDISFAGNGDTMGETRKRMKESGGGGGGGGSLTHHQQRQQQQQQQHQHQHQHQHQQHSRTLPRTNVPHLHHRSYSYSHTFPHHFHTHPHSHHHRHPYQAATVAAPHRDVYITTISRASSARSGEFSDTDGLERIRQHGLFGSETDTDDGKVTSATHTPSPHHLLNDSNETPAEEDDETTLREILVSLQRQVTVMSMNLNARLDELQTRGDRQFETDIALCEIRSQLDNLTKSMESCQSDVIEVKRDIAMMKTEVDQVNQIRSEIEELRVYVDRLEEQTHRRKLRLLQQGLTFFLSYTILASVLGMLQFGFNTGVINAPEANIETFIKEVYKFRYDEDLPETTIRGMYSFAVSVFAVGGMLGGFSGGMIADRFGRKGGLLLNNFLGIGGACLMAFTKFFRSYEILFAGRFIIGVNCGLHTSLVPMYISEISPLNLRGGLGTVNQLAVTIGLLISQILGIKQLLGTDEGWPVLLGLAVCPAILQLILLPICPESPRYLLITKQWEEEARKALRRLRASNQIEEDVEEMRAEERAQHSESAVSMIELMCSPTLRAPLIIGVVMQLSQQLSGINAVFYYSTNLFVKAGLTEDLAKFMTMGIGLVMFIMTLVTIPLMDRMGRRSLHLYGLGGMFIFSIFITISFLAKEMIDWMSYLSVVSTLGFVVFFAVGPGSIPWMITAELFSQGPRPAAMSISVLVNWASNFVVGIVFPTLNTALENYTFLPFSAFLAFFWIFTYQRVPETKNKTFEEIAAHFRHNGRESLRETTPYGSMLNCVNALEQRIPCPPPPTERASLMISEEKPIPDPCMEEFMVEPPSRPPPPLPPPRFTRSIL